MWPGATVLDVGCGSGVLSVVAARLGAPYVEAIDISPAAVEATTANAARNDVASVVDASTRPLGDVDGEFDIVLANLLAPIVVELAPALRRVTAPAGALVVSGDPRRRATTTSSTALAPMTVVETARRDDWAALLLRH